MVWGNRVRPGWYGEQSTIEWCRGRFATHSVASGAGASSPVVRWAACVSGGATLRGISVRDIGPLPIGSEVSCHGIVSSLGLSAELALRFDGGWADRSLMVQFDAMYRVCNAEYIGGYLLGRDAQSQPVLIPVRASATIIGPSISGSVLLKERLFYDQLFALIGGGGEIWIHREIRQVIENLSTDDDTRFDSIAGYSIADNNRTIVGSRDVAMNDLHLVGRVGLVYDFHVPVAGVGWLDRYNPLHISPFVCVTYDIAAIAHEDAWRNADLAVGIQLAMPVGR